MRLKNGFLKINNDDLIYWIKECIKKTEQTRNDFDKIGDKEMSLVQSGKNIAFDAVLRYLDNK